MRSSLPLLLLAGALVLAPVSASAAVVINEVDYDQPGTDTAEFIELRNNGPGAVNLGTYTVELVNGATGTLYLTVSGRTRSNSSTARRGRSTSPCRFPPCRSLRAATT